MSIHPTPGDKYRPLSRRNMRYNRQPSGMRTADQGHDRRLVQSRDVHHRPRPVVIDHLHVRRPFGHTVRDKGLRIARTRDIGEGRVRHRGMAPWSSRTNARGHKIRAHRPLVPASGQYRRPLRRDEVRLAELINECGHPELRREHCALRREMHVRVNQSR